MGKGGYFIKNNVLAILEYELDYANKLKEHIDKMGKFSLMVVVFSHIDYLNQYISNYHVDLLLVSIDMKEGLDGFNNQVGAIVLLTEQSTVDGREKYPVVYKFQHAENLVREIISYYGETTEHNNSLKYASVSNKIHINSVISLESIYDRSIFALALAQYLGKKNSALYMSMDLFSDFSWAPETTENKGLSEALYYGRLKNPSLLLKLENMIYSAYNFNYILPVHQYLDLYDMKLEDVEFLFDMFGNESKYENIVLELGLFSECSFELMEKSDCIYIVHNSDIASRKRIDEFYRQIGEEKGEEFISKFVEIEFPFSTLYGSSPVDIESMANGSLGRYIKDKIENKL